MNNFASIFFRYFLLFFTLRARFSAKKHKSEGFCIFVLHVYNYACVHDTGFLNHIIIY